MRIEALTFLRFFAAFVVVVYHHGSDTKLARFADPLMVSGSQMVTFFFVLSGFVLTISYYGRAQSSLRRFYAARVARIAPIYWCALVVAYFGVRWHESTTAGDLVLHASFLQAWVPSHVYKLNVPGWSVSVEAFFYALFPLILLVLRARRVSVTLLFVLAGGFWAFTQVALSLAMNAPQFDETNRMMNATLTFLPIVHLCSFTLGIAGGYAFIQRKNTAPRTDALSCIPILAAAGLVFGALKYSPQLQELAPFKIPFVISLFAPLFLLLIVAVSRCDNVLTRALSARPLVLLGESSYSLYILQHPVIYTFNRYLKDRTGLSAENEFYAYCVLLIAISILTLYAIERPGQRLIMRLANRFPSVIPPKSPQLHV